MGGGNVFIARKLNSKILWQQVVTIRVVVPSFVSCWSTRHEPLLTWKIHLLCKRAPNGFLLSEACKRRVLELFMVYCSRTKLAVQQARDFRSVSNGLGRIDTNAAMDVDLALL